MRWREMPWPLGAWARRSPAAWRAGPCQPPARNRPVAAGASSRDATAPLPGARDRQGQWGPARARAWLPPSSSQPPRGKAWGERPRGPGLGRAPARGPGSPPRGRGQAGARAGRLGRAPARGPASPPAARDRPGARAGRLGRAPARGPASPPPARSMPPGARPCLYATGYCKWQSGLAATIH